MARLAIKSGGEQREIPCGQMTTIGRVKPNDIVLPDAKVSRNHALIRVHDDGQHYLADLGSGNGTFVNGKKIEGPWRLSDGDHVQLGDCVLVFCAEEGSNASLDENAPAAGEATVVTVGGALHRVTILVTDIRNYTPMSEATSPDVLAKVLGQWFRMVSTIVQSNGGVVDKFIGDAVMARWFVKMTEKDDSVCAALRTARDINLAADTVNQEFPDLPYSLKIGIGINTGMAVLGNMGVASRRDYTAVGDTVNLAFRFEKATKELNKDIVMGPESYPQLPKAVWGDRLHSITVKGKKEAIKVSALTFAELATIKL